MQLSWTHPSGITPPSSFCGVFLKLWISFWPYGSHVSGLLVYSVCLSCYPLSFKVLPTECVSPVLIFLSFCLLMQTTLLFCSLNTSYCETAQWCSYIYNVLLPFYGVLVWTVLSAELCLRCVLQYSYTVCSRDSGTVTAIACSIHRSEHRVDSWLANTYTEASRTSVLQSSDTYVLEAALIPRILRFLIRLMMNCHADDQVGPVQRKAIISTPNCAVRAQNCRLKTVTLVLVILICALLILYIVLWFWYMWRAYRDLQKHQYMHYKMGNLNVRMQVCPLCKQSSLFLESCNNKEWVCCFDCSLWCSWFLLCTNCDSALHRSESCQQVHTLALSFWQEYTNQCQTPTNVDCSISMSLLQHLCIATSYAAAFLLCSSLMVATPDSAHHCHLHEISLLELHGLFRH